MLIYAACAVATTAVTATDIGIVSVTVIGCCTVATNFHWSASAETHKLPGSHIRYETSKNARATVDAEET
jgi:hypothetical protein